MPSFALEMPVAMMTALALTAVPSSSANSNAPPALLADTTLRSVNTAPKDSAWARPSERKESPEDLPSPR